MPGAGMTKGRGVTPLPRQVDLAQSYESCVRLTARPCLACEDEEISAVQHRDTDHVVQGDKVVGQE
jgi:hypothetical protein